MQPNSRCGKFLERPTAPLSPMTRMLNFDWSALFRMSLVSLMMFAFTPPHSPLSVVTGMIKVFFTSTSPALRVMYSSF